LIYDEIVDVETIAKHLADQCQQFTQYAGVRPFGVSLILGGIDSSGPQIFLTDPSGTYISYDAVAIGSGSEQVTEFLEKNYKPDISLDDAGALAAASISIASEDKDTSHHIIMSQILVDTKTFKIIPEEQIKKYSKIASEKYPSDKS
jgi:proteasome alpha subunit